MVTPLHITFLCHEYPPAPHGGIGTMTRTLAVHLARRGHRVSVVGLEDREQDGRESLDGVDVHRLARSKVPFLRPVLHARRLDRALWRIHREQAIDIVEGAEPSHGLTLGNRRSEPWLRLIRMHGGHNFFIDAAGGSIVRGRDWLERRSFGRADHVCAVSHYVAERTRELLSLGDRPIEILPNPVDTERFRPSPEAEVPGRVVFAGTLTEKKGIRQLIQAVPQVAETVPEFHLEVCGRDSLHEGRSFQEHLESLLPDEHRSRVHFRGVVPHDQIAEILASAQVLTYPSHMEAMPLAWLEGLALGKAVLASRTGPGPEVLVDGESGLLCDPHEPSSIAEGLIRLLQNEELRRALGRSARQRAEQHFSLEVMVPRNEEYYRSLLEGASG